MNQTAADHAALLLASRANEAKCRKRPEVDQLDPERLFHAVNLASECGVSSASLSQTQAGSGRVKTIETARRALATWHVLKRTRSPSQESASKGNRSRAPRAPRAGTQRSAQSREAGKARMDQLTDLESALRELLGVPFEYDSPEGRDPDDAPPGVWGVIVNESIIGSGDTKCKALEDAIRTVRGWAAKL